ncbi:MAG: YkgJ family cysteine cluster protein [Candidatus Brocadiaceae bacterium]|nr:YkgJ family cysteine cluster protein [Candidatus Brocadiaceae bacterium]
MTQDPTDTGEAAEWYADGLRFECTRCNLCCTGEPGFVWVTRSRMERMAEFLSMPVREFAARYCRRVWWRVSLKERANGDCVFLTPQGCSVYQERPEQCRSFPFWHDLLASPTAWKVACKRCPGMGTGRLYPVQEIHRIRDSERAL